MKNGSATDESEAESTKFNKDIKNDHPTQRCPFYTSSMSEVLLAVRSCLKKRDDEIAFLRRKVDDSKRLAKLKSEMLFARSIGGYP